MLYYYNFCFLYLFVAYYFICLCCINVLHDPYYFFFIYSSLAAQKGKNKGGFAATLSGALIPISQPGLGMQPGVEYRINDRLSILAEIVIPINRKNSKDGRVCRSCNCLGGLWPCLSSNSRRRRTHQFPSPLRQVPQHILQDADVRLGFDLVCGIDPAPRRSD